MQLDPALAQSLLELLHATTNAPSRTHMARQLLGPGVTQLAIRPGNEPELAPPLRQLLAALETSNASS